MAQLSKEKLNELKQSKNYTIKIISEKTGIPKSTLSKIFGGFNKNPTIDSLQKIAKALDCGLDDFVKYEEEPISPFYTDRMVLKLVEIIYSRQEIKELIEEAKLLTKEDVQILISMARRFSKV